MDTKALPKLFACGHELDTNPRCLGLLRETTQQLDDDDALRQSMHENGYLFLRNYLDRNEVLDTRRAILEKLAAINVVDPSHPLMDAVACSDYHGNEQHELTSQIPELQRLLYTGRIMQLVGRLIDAPVRHYDWTWLRVIAPGECTFPHCDVVYMGRGEQQQLFTAWTPLGDIDFSLGGLTLLENSHRHDRLRRTYCRRDVDQYCENRGGREKAQVMQGENGVLTRNPRQLRRSLNGRWLVSDYRAGDLLLFNIFTVHCGLENRTNRIRLSSDSRYQPAGEPVDDRWNGPNPARHGPGAKQGVIC